MILATFAKAVPGAMAYLLRARPGDPEKPFADLSIGFGLGKLPKPMPKFERAPESRFEPVKMKLDDSPLFISQGLDFRRFEFGTSRHVCSLQRQRHRAAL
jgi:hypothetical protein